MRKVLSFMFVGVLAAETLILGQGGDAAKVLAAAREALGGEKKLAAVTALTATGQNARSNGQASTSGEFEMALVLPDKYMRKDVIGNINGQSLARTSGFNGDALVEVMDMPQMGGGGGMIQVFRTGGPGGLTSFGPDAVAPTPEQKAEIQKAGVLSAKQDFARMTLGMFVTSFDTYPLQFTFAGTAESPDGKADIIEVKGAGDFTARLFVDQKSHLPLMLSWMAKEPITMSRTMNSGGRQTSSSGGATVTTFGQGQARPNVTPAEIQQQMKEAQAKAKTVEYRVFYSEYQNVDGIKLPTKFSRSIDGNATEELTIEKYKLNPKIDPKKFDVAK
jgi:hypothetical protein